MFNPLEGGGCQCTSFILQLFFTKCMSIPVSIFCCTTLCTAWNDSEIPCALLKPPEECLLNKVFHYFGSKDCMELSSLSGNAETSIMSASRETLPHYSNPSSIKAVPFPSYQISPCQPFLKPATPTSPAPHLIQNQVHSALQKYVILLPWCYSNTSLRPFLHIQSLY